MRRRLDAGRGLRANPPDPLRSHHTGIDLSQPAIEEARTPPYPESRINRVPRPLAQFATSFRTVSCTPLPSASARASFWRRATSATTKSCCRTYDLIMLPKRHHLPQSRSSQPGDRDIAPATTSPIRATPCWAPRSSANVRCSNTRDSSLSKTSESDQRMADLETEQHQRKPHLDDILRRHRHRPVRPASISSGALASTRTPPMTKEFYNRPYMSRKRRGASLHDRGDVDVRRAALQRRKRRGGNRKRWWPLRISTEQRMNELNVVRSLFKADPDLLERFSNACDELGARHNAVIRRGRSGRHRPRHRPVILNGVPRAKGRDRQPVHRVVNNARAP